MTAKKRKCYNKNTQKSVIANRRNNYGRRIWSLYSTETYRERCEIKKPLQKRLGVSVTYLSDIIKGRRNPPDIEGLELLANALNLNEEERNVMFDLPEEKEIKYLQITRIYYG